MMDKKTNNYTFLHLVSTVGLAGFMSLSLYEDINYSTQIWFVFILLLSLYLTQFFLIKILKENNLLFNIIAFIQVLGWLILLRLQPELALRQILWIILGLIVLLISLWLLKLVSSEFILKHKFHWLLLTVFSLSIPLLIGVEVGGAKSWLEFKGLRFQPAEAAKLSFLVFLASWFKEHPWSGPKGTWPVWLSTFICLGLLVLQRDLGTALVFYLVFLILFYLATGKLEGPLWGLIILGLGGVLAYYYFPHVQIRILAWLNPWLEPERGGYQILQSLFALASGGVLGMGLGGGIPQAIPEAHTDFVFAVLGEQLGLLGTIGIILLYLFFIFFSFKRAQSISTPGSRLLVTGLTCILIVQAFIIMGGVTKLIPLTGLPLPFMSYGGSSTLSYFLMLGIIIGLGRENSLAPCIDRIRLIKVNKTIWLIFLVLIVNLCYWQVFKAQDMLENYRNPRWKLVESITKRGTIFASDGTILASSSNSSRIYPLKENVAHLVGYASLKYGKAGLENNLNSFLLASTELKPGFLPISRQGWDVYLTINPSLQQLAGELIKNNYGAIVVLEVKTGSVLALASSPSYNPNKLLEDWESLQSNTSGILFNRATQGLYPPGSVFKILSSTVLLKLKPEVLLEKTALPYELNINGKKIKDIVYRSNLNFQEALGYSSNIYFIKHFLAFNWEKIKLTLHENFQIENDFSIKGLSVAQASLGAIIDKADLAATIIGQGEVLVTPFHMAVWVGAIANGGIMLKPRIIDRIVTKDDLIIEKLKPEVLGEVCSVNLAKYILEGMAFTVESGTGIKAQIPGIKIGGKTGSAENNQGAAHGWFIAVAPLDNPRIVVVSVVEHGGRGGDSAAPIARTLLKAALEYKEVEA